MKSFTMKALAVAVLGLAGTGVASAACTNTTPFAAWSSWNGTKNLGAQGGGSTVAGTGLNGTSCSMAASFTTSPGSNAEQAIVYDNSPQFEQSYRFRFYIDPTQIAPNLSTTKTVYAFQALSASTHGAVAPTNKIVALELLGQGGNVTLATLAACTSGDNQIGNQCRATNNLTLPAAGTTGIRIEGQVILGATGKVNIWVGSNVNPNAPDATINVNNAAWYTASSEGVKQAVMGLFASTPFFRTSNQNKVVLFDEFDSRRQTFIGL